MKAFRNGETTILVCTDVAGIGVNIPNITWVIQQKWSEQLILAVLIQHFGRARQNPWIAAVLVLFLEDYYLLPGDVDTLVKSTVTKDNQTLMRISLFQDRTMSVFPINKVEVNIAISSLYTNNMQIYKEKMLSSYYQVEPAFLQYINTTKYCRRLVLACFMYSILFDREFDTSAGSYCDIYLYQTNAEDLNNARDEIPTFKLHGIIGSLSLCYLITKEYKLQ